MTLSTFFGGVSKVTTSMAELSALKPLPAFPTFASFLEGLSDNIEESIPTMVRRFELSDRAKLLVICLVSIMSSFVLKLFAFMACFYHELLVMWYTTAAKESWHLMCSIAKQIFVDLTLVHSQAKFITVGKTSNDTVAATYLWASLQAHQLVQEYVTSNFWGHSNVAPLVTLHLYAHHVPCVTFAVLEKEVKALKADSVTNDWLARQHVRQILTPVAASRCSHK